MYIVNQHNKKMSPYQVELIDDLLADLPHNDRTYLRNILSRSYIIGVQHLMETELCLFDGLLDAGAIASQIRFAGKRYSDYFPAIHTLMSHGIQVHTISQPSTSGNFAISIKSTIREMWQAALKDIEANPLIDNIIVLDEGGRALEEMPRYLKNKYQVMVIEHTRGGLYNSASRHMNLPIIKPALSAVKKILESPKIVKAVVESALNCLKDIPYANYKVYGIVGLGNIGSALAKVLIENGYEVIVYDENPQRVRQCGYLRPKHIVSNFKSLIHNAEIIIGTTGKDITKHFNFHEELSHDIYLMSASSEDKEFKSLLKTGTDHTQEFQSDIQLKTANGNVITIISGGFPVNFNQSSESVPIQDICITRALMLSSIFQACFLLKQMDLERIDSNLSLATDASLQYYLAHKYLKNTDLADYLDKDIEVFTSLSSIRSASDGISIDCDAFHSLLNNVVDFRTSTKEFTG